MRTVKAFLIDPKAKQVSNIELRDSGDGCAKSIALAIGCSLFDSARIAKTTHVYVDDEGLYKDLKRFSVNTYGNPLAGRGVVLDTDKYGESKDVSLSIDEIQQMIKWEN